MSTYYASLGKVLVTGGTGYIGQHLIPSLLNRGYKVKVLVRKNSNVKDLSYPDIEFIYGDLIKKETLIGIADGCEIVFHLASLVEIIAPKDEYFKVIVGGTHNLIEACRSSEIKRFVFASAGMVYGGIKKTPVKEDYSCKPFYNYGKAKLEAERMLLKAYEEFDFPMTILRIFGVYGSKGGLLVDNISAALKNRKFRFIGSGDYLFHVVHIDDVVQALILAAQTEKARGHIYNIGDDEPTTSKEFVNYIAAQIGLKKPGHIPVWLAYLAAIFFETVRKIKGKREVTSDMKKIIITRDMIKLMTTNLAGDISKAKQELGYCPKYPTFREGLTK